MVRSKERAPPITCSTVIALASYTRLDLMLIGVTVTFFLVAVLYVHA